MFQEDLRESAKDRSDAGAEIWPILILRGNGDVYSLITTIEVESTTKPVVHGPLSMYPPADDNYGVDACSILCLQTVPPVVVIATCSGTLYHCVLLTCAEDEEDENDNKGNKTSWSQYGSTYSLHTPDIALYVVESVELELGLALDDNDDSYTCPIHLHLNTATESRYFCTHDTGVHMMTLPFVTQLEEFARTRDGTFPDSPPLDLLNQPSSAEYVICTRTSSSSPLQPIMGIGITAPPYILITLLSTGEVVSLPLAGLPLSPCLTQPGDLSGEEKELLSPLKADDLSIEEDTTLVINHSEVVTQNLTAVPKQDEALPLKSNISMKSEAHGSLTNKKKNCPAFRERFDSFITRKEICVKPKEDEFTYFCKNVECQLRELPLKTALLCQSKIQEVLLRERLSILNGSTS